LAWKGAIVGITLAAPARAGLENGAEDNKTPPAEAPLHGRVEVESDAPLAVGGRVSIEAPARLRFSTSLGVTPRPYADAIGAVLSSMNVGPASTLVPVLLRDGVLWRTHVGWRPLAKAGWYIDAGYSLFSIGGEFHSGDVLTPEQARLVQAKPTDALHVHSVLHMADIESGWEWLIANRVYVRTAIGAAFTFAASTRIDTALAPPLSNYSHEIGTRGVQTLNSLYVTRAFTPVLSVGLGYAFF
jgi:hypothetical protein